MEKVMKKKLKKFVGRALVVVVLLVVALMINWYFWNNAQNQKKQAVAVTIVQPENGWGVVPLEPEQVAPAVEETVVTGKVAIVSGEAIQNVETNSAPKAKRIEFHIRTKLSSAVPQQQINNGN